MRLDPGALGWTVEGYVELYCRNSTAPGVIHRQAGGNPFRLVLDRLLRTVLFFVCGFFNGVLLDGAGYDIPRQVRQAPLPRLRGMFALAIYDSRFANNGSAECVANRSRLFLARDRLGKKPLYYYRDETRIIFGSEIKAILAHPSVDRGVRRIEPPPAGP